MVAHECPESNAAVWKMLYSGAQVDDDLWISGLPSVHQVLSMLLRIPNGATRSIGPVGIALAEEVLADLQQVFIGAFGPKGGLVGTNHLHVQQPQASVWSGAVRLCLRIDSVITILLHLGAVRVDALAPRSSLSSQMQGAPIAPIHDAIANRKVKLDLQLESVELSLGQLQVLTLGDVLLLPHALDRPLRLMTDDGVTLCEGYLGQKRGVKAVELARASSVVPR